ncbi:MAG: helix-turn-helix transcriptional regulator [Bacillota bacterium]
MQTNTQDAKQRGYSFLAGVPVGEYIRRRRLTLAAQDIRAGSERLIDIALRYGYDSQAAFARAFKQVFGVTPSSVRSGAALVAYPKITFESIVKERDGGMGKYSERGYSVVENAPVYFTRDMEQTV